jgi:glycosyltransferase involved in cell wall biosynthesis
MIKTIVIVNDAAHITGGAGKVALSSAVSLAERGIHVILFTAIGPIEKFLKHKNIDIICLNQRDILNDPKRWRAIKQGIYNTKAKKEFEKVIKTLSTDTSVVHFHAWTKALSCSLFSVTSKYRFKIIITFHDFFSVCPNGALFNYKTKKICHLKPMSIHCLACNCDSRNYFQKIWRVLRQSVQNRILWNNRDISFITISYLSREIIEKYLKNRGINIYDVKNPVELNRNLPINVREKDEYFFIGRLSAEKGIDLFCKAITDLHLKGVILGDGYMLDDLKLKYPNITFTGWINSIEREKYLQNCRVLIFPSLWYETMGLVVVEAMSYGIPCIVPDQCAARQEVIDGETGYVFESGNYKSLKDAIRKVKMNDMSVIGDNIIRRFDPQIHSMDTHTNNLLDVYNDVLA